MRTNERNPLAGRVAASAGSRKAMQTWLQDH